MSSKQVDRRRFLKNSGKLAGLAVGAIGTGSGLALGQGTAYYTPVQVGDAAKEAAKEAAPGLKTGYTLYGTRSRFETTRREHDYAMGDQFPGKMVTPLQDIQGIITPS